tara:strand:+ start:2319 stop:2507 length:189 start_codon:yes stop_codon:yes gene_type:complete
MDTGIGINSIAVHLLGLVTLKNAKNLKYEEQQCKQDINALIDNCFGLLPCNVNSALSDTPRY